MKSVSKFLKNDKGFSLVEMLVVIAIMAILTGGAAASIAIVNNANVNKAAKMLDDAFSKARTNGMARGNDYHLKLAMEGNSLYASTTVSGVLETKEKISGGGVSVTLPGVTEYYFTADGGVKAVSGAVSVSENTVFTHGDRTANFWFYPITGEHGVKLN